MAHRTSVLLALLMSLAVPALASLRAEADIGFVQAAGIAAAARPGEPVFGIRKRTQRGVDFYATKSVQQFGVNFSVLKIRADDGAILNEDTEPILPPENIDTGAVFARHGEIVLGFDDALAVAAAATGSGASTVARVDLAWDFLMIFYDVRYQNGTRVRVDSVTGIVFDHGETANASGTVTTQELSVIVGNACVSAGPAWVPFEAEVLAHPSGLRTSTLLVNSVNGRVKQVQTLPGQSNVVQFQPVGRLAERVALIRSELASVVVTPNQFLEHIEAEMPGATVANVALDARVRDGAMRTRWTAVVRLANGDAAEYAVDARVPLGQGLLLGQLVAPRITGDFNGDGHVLGDDLVELMGVFGEIDPVHDLDMNGVVGGSDLSVLLRNWG